MAFIGNLAHIIKSLAKRGPKFLYVYFRESVLFDLSNGTNTHMRVPKPSDGDSTAEREDGLLYVASLTTVIRKSLRVAQDQLGSNFDHAQFLDLGCGKGKALLVYAQEFASESSPVAVGIEYDRALCEIAWRNLDRVKKMRGKAVVHCDSALNLEQYVSAGSMIVYIYNSFQGDTLKTVLSILSKYDHVLIYVDPAERAMLIEHGYTLVKENLGSYNASTWLVAVPTSIDSANG